MITKIENLEQIRIRIQFDTPEDLEGRNKLKDSWMIVTHQLEHHNLLAPTDNVNVKIVSNKDLESGNLSNACLDMNYAPNEKQTVDFEYDLVKDWYMYLRHVAFKNMHRLTLHVFEDIEFLGEYVRPEEMDSYRERCAKLQKRIDKKTVEL
jgi:hypothetical protein